jgi:V8-like Glu-specific endopeptidase
MAPVILGRRAVIGPDDRLLVRDTRDYPYRCICSLHATAADGSHWTGTGWLCGPRTLLTAGHCVYVHDRGGWARQIEVIPGRQGGLWPFGSCIATTLWAAEGWAARRDARRDYGAITLSADHAYGEELGWFGYGARPDAALRAAQLTVCGYPDDKPVGTQWQHTHTLAALDDLTLTYTMDTAGGQSGSPVWLEENGKPYGVGIHTYGGVVSNSATRINRNVLADVERWLAAAASGPAQQT